jgi:hypothetical protein
MIIRSHFAILVMSQIAKTVLRVTLLIGPSNYGCGAAKKKYDKN